jgi:GH15 family glucan-1,4-alpha-glucosidase
VAPEDSEAPTRPRVAERPPGAVAPAGAARTDPAWPSLYDYGLIGNEKTGALVSRTGSIDWACLPRFDSPSVFARLLDRRIGGAHQIAPREAMASHQQYSAGTNILTTFFELRPGVSLLVSDFMPMGPPATGIGGDPRIVRRLRARGGPVDVTITADPRFDFGRAEPSWTLSGELAVARSGEDRMAFVSPWPWRSDGSTMIATGRVEPNVPLFAQLRWGDPPPAEPSPATLHTVTESYWREWVAPPDAPLRRVAARWHPWVERSELLLKLLSYADSGVFVAAPTTSLPEWPGGTRNWDYRYVWIRDAAFTAQVFLLLGHVAEARAYVDWAFQRALRLGGEEELRTVYTVEGTPVPAEVELPHLEGFRGSRPVRVGNGAADQRQLDIYGELLDAALLLERVDPAFLREHWSVIERLADGVTQLWRWPDQGLWEARSAPAHHVHSKLMCWVALDRASQIAQRLGKSEPADRWRPVAEEIRSTILARGYDPVRGAFVQAFDRPVLDASALRIGLLGFLPPTDPKVLGTIAAVERRLADGAFVHRYEGADGIDGREGSFLLCAFWLVESLAKSGQMDRAQAHWRSLLDIAGPLLLFSEEFDPGSNQPLGNYPQAFTHIGLLRAAFALGLMAPEG